MKLEPLPEPHKAAPIQDDGQLSADMSLVERKAIEAGLGPLTYLPQEDAWDCTCPHESMHGNKPNDKDTILYRRSRYIKCSHESCKPRLKIFNKGFRETIREAERDQEPEIAWTDALKMAVVTSSQLHALKLTPHKKILGDWLAEGDLGFIFAFRGTGKTWLATAMANALATGGKLGD
jgi:AAA domain